MGVGVMNHIKLKFLIENVSCQDFFCVRVSSNFTAIVWVSMNHESCADILGSENLENVNVIGALGDSDIGLELLFAREINLLVNAHFCSSMSSSRAVM